MCGRYIEPQILTLPRRFCFHIKFSTLWPNAQVAMPEVCATGIMSVHAHTAGIGPNGSDRASHATSAPLAIKLAQTPHPADIIVVHSLIAPFLF
jgi:hypothetical protein